VRAAIASILVLLSFAVSAQSEIAWDPFLPLIGKWTGESEGQPGKGTYERTYAFVLNKQFIEVCNKSVYTPSNDHPKGEVHEDRGYISYDKVRKAFVLRQFHVEGFVNQYRIESLSSDKKTIVFVSENIENIPAGFRARETYIITNDHEFSESFEVAEPGKDFELYSKAKLKKSK
jgi:hypothetical protein